MKKLAPFLGAVLLGVSLFSQSASARIVLPGNLVDQSPGRPYFTVLPPTGVDFATLQAQSDIGRTLPFFTNSVTSPLNSKKYTFEILGTDPTLTPASTTIQYVPIVLRWHFPGRVVLDPTMPGCSDTVSVESRFFNGPLFANVQLTSNGVTLPNTQYEDAFMNAEFWNYVSGGGYHVLLNSATGTTVQVVNVKAPSGSTTKNGSCTGNSHKLGVVEINAFDNILRTIINKYAKPSQLPIVLSYNVVQSESGQCCVIGYHSAYGRNHGTQVYSSGAYTDSGIFGAIRDIYAWTHEIGEAFNDPFVNNATPSWGHVGQVSGCQGNLEVGDPLTGTPAVNMTLGGFTYHGQELAFFDWFFRTPSNGTGGYYSFEGTFKTAQGACT